MVPGPKVREPARPPNPRMLLGQRRMALPVSYRALTDSSNARGGSSKKDGSGALTPSTAPASSFPNEKIGFVWISLTHRINVW